MSGFSAITRSAFSTTTIASSTTTPMPSTRASSDTVLAEKPTASRTANVPIRLTGMATMGMIVARILPRNRNTTSTDQREGDGERLFDFVDGGGDERRTVVEYAGLQAFGEALAEFVQRRLHARRGLHRIGTGREKQADGHRRVAVQPALGVHVRRTKLYARDVGQPQHRTVRIGADHDVAELLGGDQASLRLHVELELVASLVGRAPMRPTGACTFCCWIASMMSDGARSRLISRFMSNQTRIE